MSKSIYNMADNELYWHIHRAILNYEHEEILRQRENEKRKPADQRAREKRNALLSESDYYVMPDYPSTDEGLLAVMAYRQALRDISKQEGFPEKIEWPDKPSVLR